MKTLADHLAQYAAYHRDRRNIATHFIGVPMIMLAVTVLLSRPAWDVGGVVLSPALAAALAAGLFYLRLDRRYGLTMAAVLAAFAAIGQHLAAEPAGTWLAAGLGLFAVGWVIQFVGHWYEGRKPAFVDDLLGLLIGPLFVLAEAGFMLGWRAEVQQAIDDRSGPVRAGTGLLQGAPRA